MCAWHENMPECLLEVRRATISDETAIGKERAPGEEKNCFKRKTRHRPIVLCLKMSGPRRDLVGPTLALAHGLTLLIRDKGELEREGLVGFSILMGPPWWAAAAEPQLRITASRPAAREGCAVVAWFLGPCAWAFHASTCCVSSSCRRQLGLGRGRSSG